MATCEEAVLVLLLLSCSCWSSQTAKLNIPKVLLPLARSTKTNFTLEATEGCYRWSSNRPEVASIEAVDVDENQCSQRAVLQARSTQPSRLTSIILAEDICECSVFKSQSCSLPSAAGALREHNWPCSLWVGIVDGNTFSTLAGLVFDWSLVKGTEMATYPDSYNSLRYVNIVNLGFYLQLEMDRSVFCGRLQINVGAAEVRLLILENILLSPAYDIYLLAGTSIQYKVQKIRQGKITEVVMPCDQYELHLKNSVVSAGGNPDAAVAELEQSSSTVLALQHGHTNIVLDHKSLGMKGASRLPNGTIYVVEPGYLVFKIHPGDRWILETSRIYEISIEVFDKSSNKIYLSDNIRIETAFPKEYFEVLESSQNGSYHRVKALKQGQTVIDGTLKSVVDQRGSVRLLPVPVRNEQDVEIYNPIVLTPSILTFPWQPKEGAYQYTIKATGGSGNFSWSSSNTAVATVTVKGVMTTVRDIGVSTIYAHDLRNPLHYGEMKVFVIEPVGMEFSPCAVEARVGLGLELPLRIFGQLSWEAGERVTLSDCSHFDLQVEMENSGIFQLLEGEPLPPGQDHCSGVRVQALAPGYTSVLVSYTHGNVHLNAKITIAAYPPLRAVDPPSVAVVTLGSSKDMLFEGGPKPWVLEPSKFFRNLTAEDPNSVTLTLTGSASRSYFRHLVQATCRALGEQVSTLLINLETLGTMAITVLQIPYNLSKKKKKKKISFQKKTLRNWRKKLLQEDFCAAVVYPDILTYSPLFQFEPLTPVSATLDLLLVEDVRVSPESVTIYNHPGVLTDLTLQEGSGYFFVNASVGGIAEVVFQESQGTAEVGFYYCQRPRGCRSGALSYRVLDCPDKAALIQVDDKGYLSSGSLTGMASLQITSQETFGVNQTIILAVKVIIPCIDKVWVPTAVFPPFRLLPRKVTLIIGAVMQITSEGGPQPQSNILFSLSNAEIASVNSTGLVRGVAVGNMTVTGVVQAVDTESGKLVVVSQDQVEVEVIQLKAIRIRAPITRMKSGTMVNKHPEILTSCFLCILQVPVSNYRNPELDLAAFDQQGRKFDNFSSLSMVWESSKVGLASIEPTKPMELHLLEDSNKQKKLHGSYKSYFQCTVSFFIILLIFCCLYAGFYSCVLNLRSITDQQIKVLSMSMTNVVVRAAVEGSHFSGEQLSAQLPVNPGFYADQTELILSSQHSSADLTVYGASTALQHLEVKSSSSSVLVQEKEVSNSYPSFIKYTVYLLSPQGATSATVSISSSSTGQVLVIPVTIINTGEMGTSMKGAGIVHQFVNSYQVMLFTLFALLAGTAVIVLGKIFSEVSPALRLGAAALAANRRALLPFRGEYIG
uniref:Nucleoporin 210 n=1 Tax=Astyanax mexicanus TaxID=7994 RepID=A0A8B9HPV2_ASTMX